jgi:hypothetical protein
VMVPMVLIIGNAKRSPGTKPVEAHAMD